MSDTYSPTAVLTKDDETTALRVAAQSIESGLAHGRALVPHTEDYTPPLRECWPAFVTLHVDGDLRGCVGTTEASMPLIANIAKYAHAAAFTDSRFEALSWSELGDLEINVSVLSRSSALTFSTEAELLSQLRPGIDGLILETEGARGTFLPSVWASLPDPVEFLAGLRRKMGLPRDYWSDQVSARRYTAQSFSAPKGTWMLASTNGTPGGRGLPPNAPA